MSALCCTFMLQGPASSGKSRVSERAQEFGGLGIFRDGIVLEKAKARLRFSTPRTNSSLRLLKTEITSCTNWQLGPLI